MKLEEKIRKRDQLLHDLYHMAEGLRSKRISVDKLAEATGCERREILGLIDYLAGERLLEKKIGGVEITHKGIKRVEADLARRPSEADGAGEGAILFVREAKPRQRWRPSMEVDAGFDADRGVELVF